MSTSQKWFSTSFFNNLSLGVKQNLIVLLVLIALLISVIALLNRNTQNLTKEVGEKEINQETNNIQNRFAEVEENMRVDISFLASSVNFFQAVGSRDVTTTQEIIDQANNSLRLDDIDVVDGDGKRLVDIQGDASSGEDDLLAAALSGEQIATVLIETQPTGVEVSLAVATPIVSVRGNRLGAIQISRHIDNRFLEQLIFGRETTYLGLIYADQILAQTVAPEQTAYSPTVLKDNIAFDSGVVEQAQSGKTIILQDFVLNEKGVPHVVAYTPVTIGAESSPAVIMILVELEDIYSFQNLTLFNTVVIFAALTLIALVVIYVTIYQTTLRPLNSLKSIAQIMTGGQYDQRVPVTTLDEVGQLGLVFNDMANAVQQREISLQAAREQAEQADKAKSMFLASVSHELRTPLNAVINITKFVGLGMYGPVNDEQVDALRKTEMSGKHLLELINDVLDISKIEAGSLELFVENGVNLEEIILFIADTGRTLVAGKNVEILSAIQPNLPPIAGDEQRIRQIIFNLVSNACKFTDEGQITLRVFQQGDQIRITIQDNGPGIDPEDSEVIFEIFRQAKAGIKKGGGTGLGLPISRRLAEAHGGRLWLEPSTAQGAMFCVELPIKSPLEIMT